MSHKYDQLYKIILLGDLGVGKTIFLLSLTDQISSYSNLTTIGIDFKINLMQIGKKNLSSKYMIPVETKDFIRLQGII